MPMLRLLASALLALTTGTVPPEGEIGFGSELMFQHRISGPTSVETDGEMRGLGTRVRVTVAPDGSVVDARLADADQAGPETPALLAAARQWRFRPFTYRGKPVTAVGDIDIQPRPRPVWADREAPFPEIDYATLEIGLTRTACFGSCPDYTVSIKGDGTVTFSTREPPYDEVAALHRFHQTGGVLVPGTHVGKIDRATLDGLIARFREARFFGLQKAYSYPVTDNPSYVLRFATGGHMMTVTDYVGPSAGMPMVAHALEDEIDRVAGTARWVTGDRTTVPALFAKGFDVRGRGAAQLAMSALFMSRRDNGDSDRVAVDLIEAGLPLDMPFQADEGAPREPLGMALLDLSLRLGRSGVAKVLIGRGWLAKAPRARISGWFAENGGCDADVAKALAAAGADPNAHQAVRRDMGSDGGGTALFGAVGAFRCPEQADRTALVKALLALGVDPNARGAGGKTAIFGIEDPDLLDLLLRSGARVDVKDGAGNSAVFSSWTDVIALMLLEAGADPRGKYYGDKTLPEQARAQDMPATRAWLEAHGVK